MECTRCGACCVAPDIAALDKPLGLRCPHLTAETLCAIYDRRPKICRDYQADALCQRIEAPTLEERVRNYLALFELTEEADRVAATGCSSREAAVALLSRSGSAGNALRNECGDPHAKPADSCVPEGGAQNKPLIPHG